MTYLPNMSLEEPHVEGDLMCYFNTKLWELCPFTMIGWCSAGFLRDVLGWLDVRSYIAVQRELGGWIELFTSNRKRINVHIEFRAGRFPHEEAHLHPKYEAFATRR